MLLSMKSHTCSKRQFEKSIIALLAAVCGLFTLAGCATMESASQESLLTSAGFQARTPSTEKQKAAYQALPAYQLHRVTLKGRTFTSTRMRKPVSSISATKRSMPNTDSWLPRPS